MEPHIPKSIAILACKITNHKFHIIKILHSMVSQILIRASSHDESKLEEPELSGFSSNICDFLILGETAEGAPYAHHHQRQVSDAVKDAIQHHYSVNQHHPEHYSNGISGMSLIDVIEMLADWIAVNPKYLDPFEAEKLLEMQRERFKIDEQLHSILKNTLPLLLEAYK